MSSFILISKALFIDEVCRLFDGVVVAHGKYIEIISRRHVRLHLSFRTMGTDGINPRVRVAEAPDGLTPPDYKIIALFTRRGKIGGVIAGKAKTINATITAYPHLEKRTGRIVGRPRFFELLSMRGTVNLTRFFRK